MINFFWPYVIACFGTIPSIKRAMNYRGSKKYVLVLVQCHDGVITNSINHSWLLHLSLTCEKTKRLVIVHDNHDSELQRKPTNQV